MLDVSTLKDGSLVTSVTVSDAAGNPSPAATQSTTKTGNVVTVTATDANGSEQLQDPITFVVTRTGSDTTASLTVAVTWGGIAPTAGFGTDYTVSANATQTTVTIAAGASSATVIVTPIDDAIAESTENLSLTLSPGTGYTVGTQSSASASITDNDGTPTVSIATTQGAGAEQNQVPIVFTVTRGTNPFRSITIGLGWSGTATRTTDYTVSVSGGTLNNNQTTLTLASGVNTATVTLTPIDDSTIENQETATLTLNAGTGYSVVGQSSATGTIDDNDALAVVTVLATDASGSEQGQDPIDFTVSRTTNLIKQLVFNLTWSGTATLTTDYAVTTSTPGATLSANKLQLTLASGVSSAVIHVTPVDDSLVKPTETVILTLASGTGYTVGNPPSATGTITDNDGTPTVAVAATDASGAEQGTDPITFTVTRSGNAFAAIMVNLTWGGSAVLGTNYSVTGSGLSTNSTTLSLAAGVTSATITVTPVDDTVFEGTQSVTLTIASGTGYVVGSPATATGTIADNDTPPAPTITTPTETTYAPVTITGTGVVGATIALFDGPTQIGTTTVAANGTWTISSLSMAIGNHVIGAKQTVNGLTSQPSATITVTITKPPVPTLNQPSVGFGEEGSRPGDIHRYGHRRSHDHDPRRDERGTHRYDHGGGERHLDSDSQPVERVVHRNRLADARRRRGQRPDVTPRTFTIP